MNLGAFAVVIAQIYFPPPDTRGSLANSVGYHLSLALSLIGTLLLGILPGPIIAITRHVAELVR